jgi:lantibiotic leader peptide-processing serine protease
VYVTRTRRVVGLIIVGSLAVPAAIVSGAADARPARRTGRDGGRYIVTANDSKPETVQAEVEKAGATVDSDGGDMAQIAAASVTVDGATADKLAANPKLKLARSGVRRLILPEGMTAQHADRVHGKPVVVDPANKFAGLFWNFDRLGVAKANKITLGSPDVIVAVADTGIDFTHSELAGKIAGQKDFSALESPSLCTQEGLPTDAENAAQYGGPVNTDWSGHGTWIAGSIAANLDGVGVNGIAPNVKLFDLKIAEGCGFASDAAIIGSFLYAADHGIDVVSISFGGYADRSDPDQDAIYKAYVDAVAYARKKGTLIVAAGGNEHVRIGEGGRVLSHGQLTVPGDAVDDLFGLWELPGGAPGVIFVSATGNVTGAASATCAVEAVTAGDCKPTTEAHQPIAAGSKDQLAYYSNYGPRVDVAAPGGARKFNLPNADRGGTGGFPDSEADGTVAYEEFSISSNWGLDIPCTDFPDGAGFYVDECYATIQGTSMATPHVSAVAALIASRYPELRRRPSAIARVLKATARGARNFTPPLSATDTSPGDRTGVVCSTGYCHLGGRAISNGEAYGNGIVDAAAAVGARRGNNYRDRNDRD